MMEARIPVPDIGFDPPVYFCKRAKIPFVLDGNIEKPFWEDAPFTESFVDIEGSKKGKPRFQTRAKMKWDDDNLYVGAVMEGDEIWATLTERDCVIFSDNDFEVFIDPDSDTHQYFELEINALNTVWDLMLTKPYRDFGGSPVNGWDIHGLQSAVWIDGSLNDPHADNRRWMVEIVIPFKALKEGNAGKVPGEGDYYRMNFSRVHWDVETVDERYVKLPKPENNWVWAPTGLINIHYPELWGFVFFTEDGKPCSIPEDEVLKWKLRRLYYEQHAYYDLHKCFAKNIEQIGCEIPEVSGLAMETTAHSFEIRCESSDGLHEILLFHDGKTTSVEKVTKRGCLDYLYRYMPESDAADYSGELFQKFVSHACMVKELVPWGKELSLELFLNYVLQYRVNNEDIVFYREVFFNEIYPRIQGLSMYEAALEINYWCYEKATYQTTDIRTASPFTVLKNASGRCGEESVLAVAAYRSVGIPARQCYTPRWAHCDDNHAWIEVWIDGAWHFTGACEPAPRLDMGWFQLPASKAMLIHTRVLTDQISGEAITRQTAGMTEINGLSRYAKTKEIKITVADSGKRPLGGAVVRFEVVNFAEFYPLAALETDSNGEVRFLTGLGDLMIYAYKDNSYAFQKMDVRTQDTLTLILDGGKKEPELAEYHFVPPAGGISEEIPLTKEEEEYHKGRMKEAAAARKAYEQTFIQLYGDSPGSDYWELLKDSRGNKDEILAFFNDEETRDKTEWKIKLLKTLEKKDLTDITSEILKDHLLYAVPYAGGYEEDIFCQAVLCPRVWIEPIRSYRKGILAFFKGEELEAFAGDPGLLAAWIKKNIRVSDSSGYANLTTSPLGLLGRKAGNEMSLKILCVAVLRTAGIPSRLERSDLSCMYYREGEWKPLLIKEESRRYAELILRRKPWETLEYSKNYTVAFQRDGFYQTLDFKGELWEKEEICYRVPPGACRVVAADRQPDGTNSVRIYYKVIREGEKNLIEVSLPRHEAAGKKVIIPPYEYETLEGKRVMLHEELTDRAGIVVWLSVGEEPGEHLLNELLEAGAAGHMKESPITLILKERADITDPTLRKVVREIPFIRLRTGHRTEELAYLYHSFGIRNRELPFVLIAGGKTASLAWSGYHVGIVNMLLKNMEQFNNQYYNK